MDPADLERCVRAVLTLHADPPNAHGVRILVTRENHGVMVERPADGVFRVTTGSLEPRRVYRSRVTSDPDEAARLFCDAASAQTVGFNLGGDQESFERQFDPRPTDPPNHGVKESMLLAARHYEETAQYLLKQVEETRRQAESL